MIKLMDKRLVWKLKDGSTRTTTFRSDAVRYKLTRPNGRIVTGSLQQIKSAFSEAYRSNCILEPTESEMDLIERTKKRLIEAHPELSDAQTEIVDGL